MPCRRPWKATKSRPLKKRLGRGDIYVTTTGNVEVITLAHMERMRTRRSSPILAILIMRFSGSMNERKDIKRTNIKPQVDKYTFPDGHEIFMLAEGRLVNLGCATVTELCHVELILPPSACAA